MTSSQVCALKRGGPENQIALDTLLYFFQKTQSTALDCVVMNCMTCIYSESLLECHHTSLCENALFWDNREKILQTRLIWSLRRVH
jgi:hypothetical protein